MPYGKWAALVWYWWWWWWCGREEGNREETCFLCHFYGQRIFLRHTFPHGSEIIFCIFCSTLVLFPLAAGMRSNRDIASCKKVFHPKLSPQKAPSTNTPSHSHPHHPNSHLVRMNYDTKSMAHFRLSFTWWWNPGFDTSPTPQLILSRRFPAKISFPWKIEESLLLSPDIAFVISIFYFQFTVTLWYT